MKSILAGLVTLIASAASAAAPQPDRVRLALNWMPEPEFGGFYAADAEIASKHGIKLEVLSGGSAQPVPQMVASGQVEMGIAGADELLISRNMGSDLVALFAVYQTNPQGIMVHAESGLTSIQDLLTGTEGFTLALQKGLPYVAYLEKKYGFSKLKIVPHPGGVAMFMRDKRFAQQCFITSEPISAKRLGANPKTFLIADSGYNPYGAVVVARKSYVDANRAVVKRAIQAMREGWLAYLRDARPTNERMHKLNSSMDPAAYDESAKTQIPLISTRQASGAKLGKMQAPRWRALIGQLKEIGLVSKPIQASDCYLDF